MIRIRYWWPYYAWALATGINRLDERLETIEERIGELMANAVSVLAKITENSNALRSIQAAADGLRESNASIADEIKALKDQIAAGQTADFADLDAAAGDQATLIGGLATAIGANTPLANAPK